MILLPKYVSPLAWATLLFVSSIWPVKGSASGKNQTAFIHKLNNVKFWILWFWDVTPTPPFGLDHLELKIQIWWSAQVRMVFASDQSSWRWHPVKLLTPGSNISRCFLRICLTFLHCAYSQWYHSVLKPLKPGGKISRYFLHIFNHSFSLHSPSEYLN